ncbi:hypothetical protein P7K49_019645 [Saguinus oedipus]|uniref:Uncharacterized protein n=1 Tax=Saguinus oedipus TaxID=9490 RepID=A0ABQ9UZR5_SAGOE|nr:hypothetical protein P7K49_019645 [Saguinus oedipus]
MTSQGPPSPFPLAQWFGKVYEAQIPRLENLMVIAEEKGRPLASTKSSLQSSCQGHHEVSFPPSKSSDSPPSPQPPGEIPGLRKSERSQAVAAPAGAGKTAFTDEVHIHASSPQTPAVPTK